MQIPELEPLLQKVESLRENEETRDVFEDIRAHVEAALTPSMGQSVCEHIMTMCHPKAWGDRYVSSMSSQEGMMFLSDLAAVSNDCGQAIYINDVARRKGRSLKGLG